MMQNQEYTLSLGPQFGGKQVTLELKKHKFLFGCNGFAFLSEKVLQEEGGLRDLFTGLFNAATLPFYIGRFEPEEGKPITDMMMKAAKWAVDAGLTLKGHPLVWHTVGADWLLQYDTPTIYRKTMERIEREAGNFKGLIDTWDVINEVVILPRYDRYDNYVSRMKDHYGAEEITLAFFKKVKEVNPDATLLLNDFLLTPEYEGLIERLLDKGCPIDVIGLQTHQHQGYKGKEYIDDVLQRFSRFGLPLHFTENTILSGELAPAHYDDLNDAYREDWPSTPEGEELQKQQVEEMYTQLYQHPQVESIVWWDFNDGNWLNAPSGLLRRDGSPKPAYHRLKELIHTEWGFPRQTVKVDSEGKLRFSGPEGAYRVTAGAHDVSLDIEKATKDYEVKLA